MDKSSAVKILCKLTKGEARAQDPRRDIRYVVHRKKNVAQKIKGG